MSAGNPYSFWYEYLDLMLLEETLHNTRKIEEKCKNDEPSKLLHNCAGREMPVFVFLLYSSAMQSVLCTERQHPSGSSEG